MSIFLWKIKVSFDNQSIFFHMLRKLPKKNSELPENLQNFLRTCKQEVNFLLNLKKVQKTFQIFLINCKNWFNFFDRMQKLFHFFWQNAKIFSVFLTVGKNCFTFLWQNPKKISIFLTRCEKDFHFFSSICENSFIFLTKGKKCFI